MNKLRKFIFFVAIVAIFVKVIIFSIYLTTDQNMDEISLSQTANELIVMTNRHRELIGLNQLKINPRLNQAAVNKARDILMKNYFSHTSPTGNRFSQWIKEVNYDYFYAGENLAIDFQDNNSLFDAWLNSSTHRENIEKPQYQEIGLAAVQGDFQGRKTTVVVQLFGSRILGEQESSNPQPKQISLANNYFSNQESIKNGFIKKINRWSDYGLLIILALALVSYRPQDKKNQINIKQPIINRYQAKIFKE